MIPQTKLTIQKDMLAAGVLLSGLAVLPQELGPISDLLPFSCHKYVAIAGAVGIVGSRALDYIWKLSKATQFIDLGAEPSNVVKDAGLPVPIIPVVQPRPIVHPAGPPIGEGKGNQ